MSAPRHPEAHDVRIHKDAHQQYTIAHGSDAAQIRCRTFDDALDKAGRFAAVHDVRVWYEDRERELTALLDQSLIRRVWSEFLEQPGLSLTRAQARRLWGLDESICDGMLETLTAARLLFCDSHGRYRLPVTEHAAIGSGARMAKAGLDPRSGTVARDRSTAAHG